MHKVRENSRNVAEKNSRGNKCLDPSKLSMSTYVVSLWHSVYENFLDKNLTYGIWGIQCYHLIFSKFMVVASKQSNIDID